MSILSIDFEAGFFANGVLNLTPADSYELCGKGAVIVDVREPYMNSFKMFDVEQVLYLPFHELEKSYQDLPFDKPLIFADAVGLKSRESVLFMNARGFANVANLAGGIVDWERDGLPLTTNIGKRLSGSCMCQLKPREGVRGEGEREGVSGRRAEEERGGRGEWEKGRVGEGERKPLRKSARKKEHL